MLHTGIGQIYEGRFDADLYHGPGILRGPEKDVLDGDWKWGRLNGEQNIPYQPYLSVVHLKMEDANHTPSKPGEYIFHIGSLLVVYFPLPSAKNVPKLKIISMPRSEKFVKDPLYTRMYGQVMRLPMRSLYRG